MKNAKAHLTRIEDTDDTQVVNYAREALIYLHRTMGTNKKIIAAGCDWVTRIGPEELQVH